MKCFISRSRSHFCLTTSKSQKLTEIALLPDVYWLWSEWHENCINIICTTNLNHSIWTHPWALTPPARSILQTDRNVSHRTSLVFYYSTHEAVQPVCYAHFIQIMQLPSQKYSIVDHVTIATSLICHPVSLFTHHHTSRMFENISTTENTLFSL